MQISGEAVLHAPVDRVWQALLDPAVLVATLPGCERLETTGENAYATTLSVGVAAVTGTFAGSCELTDLVPDTSLVLHAAGSGAPGTVDTRVRVSFTPGPDADGTTTVAYDADATVGGPIAGVGQRMLASVSRRMAAQFFGEVDRVLVEGLPVPASAEDPEAAAATYGPGPSQPGRVYTAPTSSPAAGGEFVKGIAVGAGLVLLGVLAGSIATRRR